MCCRTLTCLFAALSFSLAQQGSPKRDLATARNRLVGRWQSADPIYAATECSYFGRADATGIGTHTAYRLQSQGGKWGRSEHQYKVIREIGDLVEIVQLDPAGKASKIIEAFRISDNGKRSHQQLFVGEDHYKLDVGDYVYVDHRNLSCPEQNVLWDALDLGAKSAEGLAARAKIVSDGERLSKQAEKVLQRRKQ